jgi:hypothetical protein
MATSLQFFNKSAHLLKNCREVAITLKCASTGACIIKHIAAIIYGLRNKLESLSLNTRLGWKGLPGTNTLAYYGNRKLQP